MFLKNGKEIKSLTLANAAKVFSLVKLAKDKNYMKRYKLMKRVHNILIRETFWQRLTPFIFKTSEIRQALSTNGIESKKVEDHNQSGIDSLLRIGFTVAVKTKQPPEFVRENMTIGDVGKYVLEITLADLENKLYSLQIAHAPEKIGKDLTRNYKQIYHKLKFLDQKERGLLADVRN